MSIERRPSSSESSKQDKDSSIKETLNGLQTEIALRSFKKNHPEVEVDDSYPENNTSEIRNGAMMEWVAGGSAAEFRKIVDEYALNADQVHDLRDVLSKVKPDWETLH